jgi:preprotein translocase subunit SecG
VLPALLAVAAKTPVSKATTLPLTLPPNVNPNFSLDTTPHTPLAQHAPWLTHTFAGLFIIAGLLLIFLLAIQTTKQEGLSGTLGGRVEASTRRLGFEGQIAHVTSIIAIAFVIIATIVSISGI